MEKSEEQQQANESSTSMQEVESVNILSRRQQQQEANKTSISQLPSPILVNILSRLPFKAIHICKCVCKSWLNLSSDPYFAEIHFNNFSANCILARPFLTSNLGPRRKNPFVLDDGVAPILLGHDAIVRFDPDAIPFSKKCRLVNSCDGLVCLMCPLFRGSFCVCNPISGEYVMIPSKPRWNPFSVSSFGLSREGNKYKIVDFSDRFDIQGLRKWNVYVFTIGMDKAWRRIGRSVSLGGDPTCASLNGRNHWLVTDLNDAEFIRCFDFDCERLQSVLPPKDFEASKTISKWTSLGVMDDCLCLYDHSDFSYNLKIWVMKEYGVQESWTKMFVISSPFSKTEGLPTNLLNDGEFLIFFDQKRLVSYNIKEEQFTKVKFLELVARTDGAIAYKPSFILLKEIARRQNWELVDIQRHMG